MNIRTYREQPTSYLRVSLVELQFTGCCDTDLVIRVSQLTQILQERGPEPGISFMQVQGVLLHYLEACKLSMSEPVMDMTMTETTKRDGRRNYATPDQLEATRSEFIAWVQHIIDQKKWTPTDLAVNSNLAPSTILRIMNSKTHPFNISFMTIRKVAEGSGYPIPRALIEAHDVPESAMPKEVSVRHRTERPQGHVRSDPGNPAKGSPDIPTIALRHISSLPTALHTKVADTSTPRPPAMNGDETAFAVLMPDDGLMPVVRSGTVLYATKRRDPAPGDIVVVVDKAGRGRVRMVEAIDEDGLHMERLFPERRPEVVAFDDIEEFGVVEVMWRR